GPGTDVDDSICEDARIIGKGLGERGAIVITGGLGGVMEAAAEGVRSAGGIAIGLLGGVDRDGVPASHSYTLTTGLGEMRNALVVRAAQVVVAVGCSWRPLSEVAMTIRTGVLFVHLHGWPVYASEGIAAGSPEEVVSAVETILTRK